MRVALRYEICGILGDRKLMNRNQFQRTRSNGSILLSGVLFENVSLHQDIVSTCSVIKI